MDKWKALREFIENENKKEIAYHDYLPHERVVYWGFVKSRCELNTCSKAATHHFHGNVMFRHYCDDHFEEYHKPFEKSWNKEREDILKYMDQLEILTNK